MKFSSTEEYGIRCLIRIAKFHEIGKTLTIPEISKAEGLSQHNTAKILRQLRLGGFLESERGQTGGYSLTREPEDIKINEVMNVLGGRLFDSSFCDSHSGSKDICTHTIDCSVRSLWKVIQDAVDTVVKDMTLKDLVGSENETFERFNENLEFVNGFENSN
ncbi:MAG: Rrf2 family transcriptional regulator [Melioribacteraceae bacterium]|jgi:Rrf2 family protein|nr:MAG: Rrf2 family transcriptional regulator [Ignavibacteriales bacterium]WKZ70371.1 MAG: Rrf2 family transcriptional regulator [Melioribacteraceae bacterium]